MNWLSKLFKADSGSDSNPEDVIRFYQQLDVFTGADPAAVIQRYIDDHEQPPNADTPWDDVFLLAYAGDDVWADDPEADVCPENDCFRRLWLRTPPRTSSYVA